MKESKADVNKKEKSGYTPMLLAAYGCKAEPQAIVVRQLVREGADKFVKSPKGETAHDICKRLGCKRCWRETDVTGKYVRHFIFTAIDGLGITYINVKGGPKK